MSSKALKQEILNTDPEFHKGNFPNFKKPDIKGYFSLNNERTLSTDFSQLKYIHNPNSSSNKKNKFDLNHGLDRALKKNEFQDEKLDSILRWILQTNEDGILSTDFVCYRGLLSVLMCTPYERQDGWIIRATKWKRTIFLCAKMTEERMKSIQATTNRQKQFMSWGYKFEQYMTKDSLDSQPDTLQPVDEREEFCAMFQSRLSGHHVLYGAEMDGIRSNTPVDTLEELKEAEFVELKTSRHIQSGKQNQNFQRYKLIKWWCQSFLVGIGNVTCGFRDDNGIVHELQDFSVRDIPKMVQGSWNPCVCMNFCSQFLNLAKRVVKEGKPDDVFVFRWSPEVGRVTYEEVKASSDLAFLPRWFTEVDTRLMGLC